MSHKPSAELDTSVRERLLAAATTLFAQKGYSATTVREIVAAAGVTKPVLYYYFQSKEGLYLELMRQISARFLDLIENQPVNNGTVRHRLLMLGQRAFQVYRENQELMKVVYSIYFGPPQGAPNVDFDAILIAYHRTVADLVREGLDNGELRPGDPRLYTWILTASVHQAMEMEMCLPQIAPGEKGLAQTLNLLMERLVDPDPQDKD